MNQIWLMLGLKPEGFRAGMKKALDDTKEFEKGWKGLAKIFAAGGIATLMIGFFKALASEAQQTRSELEKLGQPIPQSVSALATLGDAFDGFGKIAGTVVGTVLSGWKSIFDLSGSLINRLNGVSEAQENIAAAAARGAEEQEAALAKARAENSPEKIKAAQKDLDDFRRKAQLDALEGEQKMSALLQENIRLRQLAGSTDKQTLVGIKAQKDLEQNVLDIRKLDSQLKKDTAQADEKANREAEQAAKHLADEHDRLAKAKFEGLTLDKQIETLDRSRAILEQNITSLKRAGVDTTTEEADLAEIINELASKRKDLTEQTAATEAKIKKAIEDQAEAEERRLQAVRNIGQALDQSSKQLFALGNGKDFSGASDEALKEIIRQGQAKLQGLDRGTAFDYGDSFAIAQITNQLDLARKELALRSGLRNDVGLLGVEGARGKFQGDPLIFDRLVQQFTTGIDQGQETNRILRDIQSKLNTANPAGQQIADLLARGVETVVRGSTGGTSGGTG